MRERAFGLIYGSWTIGLAACKDTRHPSKQVGRDALQQATSLRARRARRCIDLCRATLRNNQRNPTAEWLAA